MNAIDDTFWRGRRVLVTGHTGCKGAWLCEWLLQLGADVHGLSLPETPADALGSVLGLRSRLAHHECDVTDAVRVQDLVRTIRPEVVFHLAAQSLVLRSYREPLPTLATNVMGTANLFAAISGANYTPNRPCAVVCVTSDKCYRNDGTGRAFTETAPFGGGDLYSASKAMVELLAQAWRHSFFAVGGDPAAVRLATARAGNVIGGGDIAADRIVVDAVRALASGRPILVRQPQAVRPWQHVLDPLAGYLALAQRLFTQPGSSESGWNFGPLPAGERTVGELCDSLVAAWGSGSWQHVPSPSNRPEAQVLRLDSRKAKRELGWRPTWPFATAIARTVDWYREAFATDNDQATMIALTQAQIAAFSCDRQTRPPRTPQAGTFAPLARGAR